MPKLKINYGGEVTNYETIELYKEKYDATNKVLTIPVSVNVATVQGEVRFNIFSDNSDIEKIKSIVKEVIKKDSEIEVIIDEENNKQIKFNLENIFDGDIEIDIFEIIEEKITVIDK